MTNWLLNYILFAIIGSLVMCGWYVITRHEVITYDDVEENGKQEVRGKIFKFWSVFFEQTRQGKYRFPHWVHAPLSSCVYCYASIYGSIIFWVGGLVFCRLANVNLAFSWYLVLLWIAYCFITSALNGIIIKKVL